MMKKFFFLSVMVLSVVSAPLDSLVKTKISSLGYASETVGFVVQAVNTKTPLLSINADKPYYTASVQKLITGAAAFDRLGVAYSCTTTVSTVGLDTSGKANILVLKGSGDPGFTVERLWIFALQLKHQGVTAVDTVVLDNSFFDSTTIGPGFKDNGSQAYLAPVTPLAANFNTIAIHVAPTVANKKARISLMPEWISPKYIGSITTVPGKKRDYKISTDTLNGETIIRLSGTVGEQARSRYTYRKIWSTEHAFASSLESVFQSVGISYNGSIRSGATPDSAQLLTHFTAEPLAEHINNMFKYSNNFIAEMLLRTLGSRESGIGSWPKGVDALTSWWHQMINKNEPIYNNGSGMGGGNRATPQDIIALLSYVEKQPWRYEYYAAMPLAGVDGTLMGRFKKSPMNGILRGKTGTLKTFGAINLAGVFDLDGTTYHYVLFINNKDFQPYDHWKFQEALFKTLYDSLSKK